MRHSRLSGAGEAGGQLFRGTSRLFWVLRVPHSRGSAATDRRRGCVATRKIPPRRPRVLCAAAPRRPAVDLAFIAATSGRRIASPIWWHSHSWLCSSPGTPISRLACRTTTPRRAPDGAQRHSYRGAFTAKFSSFRASPRRHPRAPVALRHPPAPAPEKTQIPSAPHAREPLTLTGPRPSHPEVVPF